MSGGIASVTIEQIQDVIAGALVGQTLTGGFLSCALVRGKVDQNAAVQAFEVRNGDVVVTYQGGRSLPKANTPSAGGGTVQRRWAQSFRARVTYSNRVAAGQDLASDVSSFARQIVNLIEAALEPSSGTNYDIPEDGIQLVAPAVHARDPGFNVQDVMITVRAFWAR